MMLSKIGVASLLAAAAAATMLGVPAERGGDGLADTVEFSFGIVGDAPYTEAEKIQFDRMTRDLNGDALAFVVHVGDIKDSSTPCTNSVYFDARRAFNDFAAPLIYTPGDNDWTDCHLTGGNPLERLAFLREVFFSRPESLGQRRLRLSRQSDAYPENARWNFKRITFATLHVVGANNNLPIGDGPGNAREYEARNAANLKWLARTFEVARGLGNRAVVVVMQADPHFLLAPDRRTGFNDTLSALARETASFEGQVVLIHGDTHYFRIDKPLALAPGRRALNFTRVETFGSPDVHWVKARVDASSEAFSFRAEIVGDASSP